MRISRRIAAEKFASPRHGRTRGRGTQQVRRESTQHAGDRVKIALVQMNSQADKQKNLDTVEQLIATAVAQRQPDLLVLPEYFSSLTESKDLIYASSEVFPEGGAYRLMSRLAKENGVSIHAGSIVEREGDRYYNSTVVFDSEGQEIAKYRKMHLFDIDAPDGRSYRESDTISRGLQTVTYELGHFTVGCAICYDLRFPEFFRSLRDKGADVIVLPAAFTLMTGKDHWEPLVRARAIETQTYFLAVGQTLVHDENKWCWGHSMVVDPWGHVIAQCSDGEGVTDAFLDRDLVRKVRVDMPVDNNRVL